MAVHQWLGVAVGLFTGYHLWKHWSWVKAVTTRLFGRTSGQSRVFYTVDAGLAVGLTAISVTGLVISTWLDLPLGSYHGLARCPRDRLSRHSGAAGRQDRVALALDRQRRTAQRLPDAGSSGGHRATCSGCGPGEAANVVRLMAGRGRGGAVGRLQCVEGSGG